MFPKSILKNKTQPATWEDTLPTEEQMHFPFAAWHQPCHLWKHWKENQATGDSRQNVPQPALPVLTETEMSAATNEVLRARCGFG